MTTGKVALNWQATPTNFLYAFVATGFKPGGVNVPDGTYLPEEITDYEAGWKASFLNRHITTQVGVFSMDYTNLQLNIFNPQTTNAAAANAGQSKITGFEAQLQARLGSFNIDAGVANVQSSVGELSLVDTRALPGGSSNGLGVQCPTGVPSNPPACFDYTPYTVSLNGRRNPYSPDWTANIGIEYHHHLANGDELAPRIDGAYLSEQTTSIFETPILDILPSRQIWNARLTYYHKDWHVTGYITNLFDELYRSGNDGNNTWYGAPRQMGLTVGRTF
jgi:iron complex outermembrane receptor protein